jgi:hypothetical protein
VNGARGVGMRGILLSRTRGVAAPDPDVPVIGSLRDLLAVI